MPTLPLDPRPVILHLYNNEESLEADDRDTARPAARVEQRVFDQLSRSALGVSAFRQHACPRGRALT